MAKFGEKEILHNPDFEAISVTVDATTTGTVTESRKKVLKAGTPVAGVGGSIFDDRTRLVKKVTDNASADGILLHDVDLTDGNSATAMVYQGTIRSDCVAGFDAALKNALPRIQFVKGV